MLSLLLLSSPAIAQERTTVSAIVVDEQGTPLIGASVVEKGTPNAALSDAEGRFSIAVSSPDAMLAFEFIGFKPVEKTAAEAAGTTIVLEEDRQLLDEVVVIGYGTLAKKEVSSSIVQVNKRDFQQAVSNPMELITGKVAGLNVNNTASANPNAGSSLQIRGATSISASNSPLIIIDGIAGGDIRNLASQDIESVTVLKDGASSAIYGTRGANGVILITTRRASGEAGTKKVTYDSWFGVNLAHKGPEVLSPEEFRRSMRGNDYGASTDWYNLLLRDFSYDHNQYLSLDATTKGGYYGASFNYKQATGLDIASARNEFGGRFMAQQRILDDRLEINGSLSARKVEELWGDDGQFDNALTTNPTMPVYAADGNYYHPTSPTNARNPYEEVAATERGGERIYLLGSAEAKLTLFRDDKQSLNTVVNYSLQYNDLNQHNWVGSTSGEAFWQGYKGRATVQYQKWWFQRAEWLFNYAVDFGDHSIKAVAGYTYEQHDYESIWVENKDFAMDNVLWHDIGSGSFLGKGQAGMSTSKSLAKLIGLFGRVNYNWKDLLMASASLRYEGSTKFGANNKWGYFPAASAAWEIANMNFMETAKDVVNSLKLRASFGVTGRSDFDTYLSMATYSTRGKYFMDGEWVQGYAPSVNANPDLAWEKSINTNIGVDFVLWNRLRGSVDYFDRRSQDLLYTYTAPQPPYVYSTIMVNVGTTKNTGIELSLEGDIFNKKDFGWTSGVLFSYGTTQLTKLSNDIYQASYLELYQKPGVGTTEYFFRVAEGGEVANFYGYEHAGVSDDGQLLIYAADGSTKPLGMENNDDKRYIGNGAPKSFLSWNNTFRYKNFDLNVFFRGAFGFQIMNMRRYGMGLKSAGTANVLREAYTKYDHITGEGNIFSTFYLEDGDYLKLENLTVGYNIKPVENRFVENIRVYVAAKNLFTLTGYSGNDPSIVTSTGLTPGVDVTSAYPSATQLCLGLTVHFK
jgi:TonB-linked SusC/RagA family outer membrane protein